MDQHRQVLACTNEWSSPSRPLVSLDTTDGSPCTISGCKSVAGQQATACCSPTHARSGAAQKSMRMSRFDGPVEGHPFRRSFCTQCAAQLCTPGCLCSIESHLQRGAAGGGAEVLAAQPQRLLRHLLRGLRVAVRLRRVCAIDHRCARAHNAAWSVRRWGESRSAHAERRPCHGRRSAANARLHTHGTESQKSREQLPSTAVRVHAHLRGAATGRSQDIPSVLDVSPRCLRGGGGSGASP